MIFLPFLLHSAKAWGRHLASGRFVTAYLGCFAEGPLVADICGLRLPEDATTVALSATANANAMQAWK